MAANLANEIRQMREMTVPELRERYAEVFGEKTTSRHKDYLRKRVAWRLQALAEGALPELARADLEANPAVVSVDGLTASGQTFRITPVPANPREAFLQNLRRSGLPHDVVAVRGWSADNVQVYERQERDLFADIVAFVPPALNVVKSVTAGDVAGAVGGVVAAGTAIGAALGLWRQTKKTKEREAQNAALTATALNVMEALQLLKKKHPKDEKKVEQRIRSGCETLDGLLLNDELHAQAKANVAGEDLWKRFHKSR